MSNALTVDKANNLFQLGKWILGFLGILIGGVFWGTFYGTSYMKDTKFSIDTLSKSISVVHSTQIVNQVANDKHFDKIDKAQSDMQSDIDYLKGLKAQQVKSIYPTRTVFRTQHVDSRGNRTMVR